MSETVTMPPKSERISKPDSATWTSGPKTRLSACWMTMAMPKVASSETNMSLSTTRRMMVT